MQISANGLNYIKQYENFKSYPYRDTDCIWTIGFGTTHYPNGIAVSENDHDIILAQANQYLEYHCDILLKELSRLIVVNLTQNSIDALCSLIYNIGIGNFKESTLLKCINLDPNDIDNIQPHWYEWDRSGGKFVQGLENRRINEFELYKK